MPRSLWEAKASGLIAIGAMTALTGSPWSRAKRSVSALIVAMSSCPVATRFTGVLPGPPSFTVTFRFGGKVL